MEINAEQFAHVGVLMGGYSSEREISLKSGKAVYEALKGRGLHVTLLDITEKEDTKIKGLIAGADLNMAFIALHGRLGEDGTIQSILEDLNIPYTGSGIQASRLALNKVLAQDLFRKNNVNVPVYVTLVKGDMLGNRVVMDSIDFFPVVVKPACEGSSIGVSVVRQPSCLEEALQEAWRFGEKALVEKYIKGRELTVGILDQKALPIVEIRPHRGFFDFTAKYGSGMSDYIVPAQVPSELSMSLQEEALKAHCLLGCEDLSRVDFMLDSKGAHYLLEVNTIPGFTSTSLLPKAAAQAGIYFDQLCLRLVELAYGKKKKIKNIN